VTSNWSFILQLFMTFRFCRGHPAVFNELKDNTIVSGVSQAQHYILLCFILFNLDIMFQSNYHLQAICTKLRTRHLQCR